MTWAEVIANPFLQNLPLKIELNRWGRIEMSPTGNKHGLLQADIGAQLGRRHGGRPVICCSVQTEDGVRVADVAWISNDHLTTPSR